MALLRTQIVRKVQNQLGSAISGANATIYSLPDNSLATVYTGETGTATYTQPLQSGLDGSFAGWLELGDYSITIASSAGTSTSRYYANHPQQSYLETYDASDVPLTIKAGTALTANMAEWKDSSGSTVMSVSTAGSITSPTVTAIQGSVNNTQGSVNSTQGSVSAVNSSLGSALGTISTNTAAIGSVSGTVGTAVSNISNLTSSLGSALGTISTNNAAIGSVSGTVANLVTVPFGTVAASYTIGTADANELIKITSSTAITITLPPNGSVAFPVGQKVDFLQMGTGTVTFGTAAAGTAGTVTILATPSLIMRTRYSVVSALKTDTNEWTVFGDLS